MKGVHMNDTGATEVSGRCWFTAQLLRSGVEVARPERDIGVDLVTYTSSASWMLPIQLKVVGLKGLTVFHKYVGEPIALAYVLLGDQDGGNAGRTETSAYLLTPEEAWGLPSALGQKFDPDFHTTYRFSSLTRMLIENLEAHRVLPGSWRERLEQLAPLRRALAPID
ncbi:hypothetical protein ADL21_09215 [Streptomyces albus subsp. albus]|nr:hypothetical protein ADL21_09215 [Streptomyces albus subsp. albus]